MFCIRCGHEVAAGIRFCPNCGSPADRPAQPAAAPPPPPPQAQFAQQSYNMSPPAAGSGAPSSAAPQWAAAYPAAVQYAGFWRRFLAYLIDGLIAGVAFVAVMFVLGTVGLTARAASDEFAAAAILAMLPLMLLVLAVAGWLYFASMESSPRQATIGKMAIGIKVTDLAGNRLTFARATGRYFAKFITGLIPFGVGYMLAGWTAKKQALHDMIVGTLVVCRP